MFTYQQRDRVGRRSMYIHSLWEWNLLIFAFHFICFQISINPKWDPLRTWIIKWKHPSNIFVNFSAKTSSMGSPNNGLFQSNICEIIYIYDPLLLLKLYHRFFAILDWSSLTFTKAMFLRRYWEWSNISLPMRRHRCG